MLLSRLRPGKRRQEQERQRKKLPELDELLLKRDYAGAISLLEYKQKSGDRDEVTELWLAHCYFRAGDYKKAAAMYEWMMSQEKYPREIHTYLGCCLFLQGLYTEAMETAEKALKSPLQNRLIFHIAHKLNDEKKLLAHHSQLQDEIEDQLSLASIHYLRMHYQQAIDIYKKILINNKNFIALNVYLALCYYKLDYYDVALDVLQVYTKNYPESAAAMNLKACCLYKLYNGKAAEAEVEQLYKMQLYPFARDLIKHNSVVFKNGDGALQIMPSLIDVVPEARLNLIIYYLKRDEIEKALEQVDEMEPQVPQEFVLKAITFTHIGMMRGSKDHLKTAEQFFRMVGQSAAECDTIVGRQAMASSFFLQKQFDDALIYLNSIKTYFLSDDTFNFNYGQTLLKCGQYAEAESALLLIQGEHKKRPVYNQCLCRAFIFNKKPQLAWDVYKRLKNPNESFTLLNLIAHDTYQAEEYFYSCLAFDALEKTDPSPEHWEGKRGAAAGVFQLFVEGRATREQMAEVVQILEAGHHPQVEFIVSIIRKWARENGVHL